MKNFEGFLRDYNILYSDYGSEIKNKLEDNGSFKNNEEIEEIDGNDSWDNTQENTKKIDEIKEVLGDNIEEYSKLYPMGKSRSEGGVK